jgi:predicted nucleotide-binding protein (sugar kinase/HSP70/actin superfamily)
MCYDDSVDTIFEIGGQDAKYIRLSEGNITDFALNEACSAGTGSFLQEVCNRFPANFNFDELNSMAIKAENGISLGQHCSVFIADVIEKSIASGCKNEEIAVGLFDSIISNYINRVKKNRTIGKKVFCQGMPFNSEALACAVVRQIGTKVFIPDSPGTVGAFGVSLLAKKELEKVSENSIEINKFLVIDRIGRDTFICESDRGCLAPGNKCTIEKVVVNQRKGKDVFYWGGSCTLWEKDKKAKLPQSTPNPFLERKLLVQNIKERLDYNPQFRTVAMTENIHLFELFPFFATYINNLGFNIITDTIDSYPAISHGKNKSNVSFCIPALMYLGYIHSLSDSNPDVLFNPVFLDTPNYGNIKKSSSCPVIQGSSYLLKSNLEEESQCEVLSPTIKMGKDSLNSDEFYNSCKAVAKLLGVKNRKWEIAFQKAIKVQHKFYSDCYQIGNTALIFCAQNNILPVIILGKLYSIYDSYLNSNIPDYLREFGILPIPMDCYKVDLSTPFFSDIYWGYSQYVLRAAYQIRESKNIYSILCTNYSCGPDSFLESYYNYINKGSPSLIIENDGDTGHAGIKMRLEVFLHCIKEREIFHHSPSKINFKRVFTESNVKVNTVFRGNNKILLPYIGYTSSIAAACLRGSNINAEALPVPDEETLEIGRRYTSGKECFPMSITLGSLLQYIHKNGFLNNDDKIYYFMPGSEGPCRFGNYNILDKIIIENLGLQNRVFVLSPANQDFFNEIPSSLNALIYLALVLIDHLVACSNYIRPIETKKGEANRLFDHYYLNLIQKLEEIDCYNISNKKVIWEMFSGHLFGFAHFLNSVAQDFSAISSNKKIITIAVGGALYVRLDPFSNQNVVDKIESRGLRIKQTPFTEWLDFLNISDESSENRWSVANLLNRFLKGRIRTISNNILYSEAGIPKFPSLNHEIKEINPYIGFESIGEAILSIGGSVLDKKKENIAAILNIGPTECLQCKISESMIGRIQKKNNVIFKSLEVNGDPMDPVLIDDFIYDVKNACL